MLGGLHDRLEEYFYRLPNQVLYMHARPVLAGDEVVDFKFCWLDPLAERWKNEGFISTRSEFIDKVNNDPQLKEEYMRDPFAAQILTLNSLLHVGKYDNLAAPHAVHINMLRDADYRLAFYLDTGAMWAAIQREEFAFYFERRGFEYYHTEKGRLIPTRLAWDLCLYYAAITAGGILYVYDAERGVYVEGVDLIKNVIQNVIGDEATEHRVREVIEAMKRISVVRGYPFDTEKRFICVRNGVYDIEDDRLLPHSPAFGFTRGLEITYRPDADCPAIDKFFHEVVAVEDVELLYEIVGYCLYNDYHIQRAFMLVGDGKNGKSTFLQLLIRFLGVENVSTVPLQDFDNNRFAASQLLGKMANICADLPPVPMRYTGVFKMLTGGDYIQAERKFKDPFKFRNTAKLIFSANATPQVTDHTFAFWRRWILVYFPHKFEGEKCDPNLIEKLTTDAELSGLFNRAVAALRRLLERGDFSASHTTEELMLEWKKRADSVFAFVSDCIISDPVAFITKDELYNAYTEYCREHELKPLAKNTFSQHLLKHVSVREAQKKIEGRRVRVWQGIKLRPVPLDDEEGVDYIIMHVRDALLDAYKEFKTPIHFDELVVRVQGRDNRIPRGSVEQVIKQLVEDSEVMVVGGDRYVPMYDDYMGPVQSRGGGIA